MEANVRALLLFTVIILSATEEVKKNLTATEGGNITLPDPPVEFGFLLHERKILASVKNKQLEILEEIYKNKLHWNEDTRYFTITDLKRNDSGIYSIDSKTGSVSQTSYKLTVYAPVSAPTVKTSETSDSCILLCVVDKAEDTTLLWYKDEEKVKQNSSVLSLSLTVHKQDYKSSYRCEAANPVENKTTSVNVNASCGQKYTDRNQGEEEPRHRNIIIAISIVFTVIILLVALILKKKCLHRGNERTTATQGQDNQETDVTYTDVQFEERKRSQQVENSPESPGNVDRSQLTTVYDKLESHRLVSHPDEQA